MIRWVRSEEGHLVWALEVGRWTWSPRGGVQRRVTGPSLIDAGWRRGVPWRSLRAKR